MRLLKLLLVLHGLLFFFGATYSRVYISEIINNSYKTVQIAYQFHLGGLKIINSKSIKTGERGSDQIQDGRIITLSSESITSFQNAYIPNYNDGRDRSELHIGYDVWSGSGIGGAFAAIYQKNNTVELITLKDLNKTPKTLQTNLVENNKYVLEIGNDNNLKLYPRSDEKVESYFNPGKLQPQELLHQAIINDSIEDIEAAIKMGANIDMGIGNQPPLLLAIIMGKEQAIQTLLNIGANPAIQYLNKPLILFIVKKFDFKLAKIFLTKQLNLSEQEKQEIINYIMLNNLNILNQDAIDVLAAVGYIIKNNFGDSDLTKNKWYDLLRKHASGYSQGKPLGNVGLPNNNQVQLFIKNGANPNQVFELSDKSTMTPIFLIIDNYIASPIQSETGILLTTLVDAKADINKIVQPNIEKGEESPLSYALKNDEYGYIVDFLTKKGASIEDAVKLFLKNGGSINKILKSPFKTGTFSLLSWVVENNNPGAAQLLISTGNPMDKAAALKYAISKGYGEIIKILMAQ